MNSEVHTGPLAQASEESELQAGPLPKATKAARYRKTEREKRWERKRRRRTTEEVLGWILVPVIVIGCFWAAKATLNALGTSPTALFQGIKTAISASGKF